MKTRKGFLYWAPRILCIIAILFLSLFALDSFGTGKSVFFYAYASDVPSNSAFDSCMEKGTHRRNNFYSRRIMLYSLDL